MSRSLLTISEAAEQLRVSIRTLEREARAGRLAIVRIRSRRLVEVCEIDRYIAAARAACPSDTKETGGKFASAQALAIALSNAFRPAPPATTRRRSKLRCAGDSSNLRLVASTAR